MCSKFNFFSKMAKFHDFSIKFDCTEARFCLEDGKQTNWSWPTSKFKFAQNKSIILNILRVLVFSCPIEKNKRQSLVHSQNTQFSYFLFIIWTFFYLWVIYGPFIDRSDAKSWVSNLLPKMGSLDGIDTFPYLKQCLMIKREQLRRMFRRFVIFKSLISISGIKTRKRIIK